MKHLNPNCPNIEIGEGDCPRCNLLDIKQFENGKQYLCAIGNILLDNTIDNYCVGMFVGGTFFFKNGSYGDTELYFRKKIGSSVTTVLYAKLIDDIDLTTN